MTNGRGHQAPATEGPSPLRIRGAMRRTRSLWRIAAPAGGVSRAAGGLRRRDPMAHVGASGRGARRSRTERERLVHGSAGASVDHWPPILFDDRVRASLHDRAQVSVDRASNGRPHRRAASTAERGHQSTTRRVHQSTTRRVHQSTTRREHQSTTRREDQSTTEREHQSTDRREHQSTDRREHQSTTVPTLALRPPAGDAHPPNGLGAASADRLSHASQIVRITRFAAALANRRAD
jgi:hypothetical protein